MQQDITLQQTEEAVITTLLSFKNILPDIVGWLQPDMFQSPDLAFIYTAICEQYNRGEQPDFLTTETEMRRIDNKRTEQINGIAILGASLTKLKHGENIKKYAAEIKRRYLLRQLQALCKKYTEIASYTETDPIDLMGEIDAELLQIRQTCQTATEPATIHELAQEALNLHLQKIEQGTRKYQVNTGLKELDALLGGMQQTELFVLAGRPADGKTALAIHIATHAALQGKQTLMYSLEMSNFQQMNRIFAGKAGIDPEGLRRSRLTKGDIENMQNFITEWKDVPFRIDYTPGNTIENIRAQVLLLVKQQKCDFVVLDYLHLLRTQEKNKQTQDLHIAHIIHTLKLMAMEANIPVLVISQMNREIEKRTDHEPQLSDLRDSGSIEQEADCVFFAHRPTRYKITHDPITGESFKGVIEIPVVKNRNGNTGRARIRHNNSFTQFTNYDNQLTIEDEQWI